MREVEWGGSERIEGIINLKNAKERLSFQFIRMLCFRLHQALEAEDASFLGYFIMIMTGQWSHE